MNHEMKCEKIMYPGYKKIVVENGPKLVGGRLVDVGVVVRIAYSKTDLFPRCKTVVQIVYLLKELNLKLM
jgi:hypothetical protein